MTLGDALKRVVVGRPLRSAQLRETLLPKWLALPIFCSDPISSVAYATEEILLVLALGGATYLALTKWVALAIVGLLIVVVASYRQTCFAYPNGGGAFAVSLDNFGENAALVAASALLVDYVLTVAVAVTSGVAAVTSAAPFMSGHAVLLSLGFVVLLVVGNLRGTKESGRAFAIPTYAFIALTYLMFAFGALKGFTGHLPDAVTLDGQLTRTVRVGGVFTLLLWLRAFASGCTALTGVEAISNGVASFRPPKSRNAANTLAVMGALAATMFVGITVLALMIHARAQPSGHPSVISQIAASAFGRTAVLFYLYQAATAGILVLAANTAFNGFPMLASILARSHFLPRQLGNRGDKLVFSNGIVALGGFAIGLIACFDANLDRLIQLYIVGVFTSFTLSQSGMVRRWNRVLRTAPPDRRRRHRLSRLINLIGATATGLVLLIVLGTKVAHGAWIAILAMMALFLVMKSIHAHYNAVAEELLVPAGDRPLLPSRNHGVILVSRLHLPTMRAIAYAKAVRPSTIRAVTVRIDDDATQQLQRNWADYGVDIPLVILEADYRDITRPVVDYIRQLRRNSPRDVVTVFIPEYVLGRWWERLLHNRSALRLKARLMLEPGVMITSVPWQLRSAAATTPLEPGDILSRPPDPGRCSSAEIAQNAALAAADGKGQP